MPNNYINQINNDGTLLDVHDERIPEVSSGDSGKTFVVNANGEIEKATPSGGTQLYQHDISGTNTYVIISRYGEVVNSYDKFLECAKHDNLIRGIVYQMGSERHIISAESYGSSTPIYVVSNSGTFGNISISDADTFADTVTPL